MNFRILLKPQFAAGGELFRSSAPRFPSSVAPQRGASAPFSLSTIPIFPPEWSPRGQPVGVSRPLPWWPMQAKLVIGATDDPQEREAERVADNLMP